MNARDFLGCFGFRCFCSCASKTKAHPLPTGFPQTIPSHESAFSCEYSCSLWSTVGRGSSQHVTVWVGRKRGARTKAHWVTMGPSRTVLRAIRTDVTIRYIFIRTHSHELDTENESMNGRERGIGSAHEATGRGGEGGRRDEKFRYRYASPPPGWRSSSSSSGPSSKLRA